MHMHGTSTERVRTAVNDALAHHGVAEGDANLVHKLPEHVGRQLAVCSRTDHQQRVSRTSQQHEIRDCCRNGAMLARRVLVVHDCQPPRVVPEECLCSQPLLYLACQFMPMHHTLRD